MPEVAKRMRPKYSPRGRIVQLPLGRGDEHRENAREQDDDVEELREPVEEVHAAERGGQARQDARAERHAQGGGQRHQRDDDDDGALPSREKSVPHQHQHRPEHRQDHRQEVSPMDGGMNDFQSYFTSTLCACASALFCNFRVGAVSTRSTRRFTCESHALAEGSMRLNSGFG